MSDAEKASFDEFRELIARAQRDAYRRGVLSMWTIYRQPKDYPDSYVARMSEIDKGKTVMTESVIETDANDYGLEILRGLFLDCALTRLPRSPQDDPVIVEVWL